MIAPASPFVLPPGYGFRAVGARELKESGDLLDVLIVWEKPRPHDHHRYVVSVDVSDGLGQDRSVIDVTRVGTLREPDEQVAQFVTDTIPPLDLAPIVDAVGRLYADADGYEALCAVECNNQGIAVQNELQAHLGYGHFYVWQYADARDPSRRFSTRIGWFTTPRTRPILLTRYHAALTTLDPISGAADYLLNSSVSLSELRDFQTEGALWQAEASAGAHDDTVMAGSIGVYVCSTLHHGEREPIADARRRHAEEDAAKASLEGRTAQRRDARNTAVTAEDIADGILDDPWTDLDDPFAEDDSVAYR